MKIQIVSYITFFGALLLSSGNSKAQIKLPLDDRASPFTMKAKFVKRIVNEYCGTIHIPERNMFETFTSQDFNTRPVKTIIEVEYNTGCVGTVFIPNQTYSIVAVRVNQSFITVYRNIKTIPDSVNSFQ